MSDNMLHHDSELEPALEPALEAALNLLQPVPPRHAPAAARGRSAFLAKAQTVRAGTLSAASPARSTRVVRRSLRWVMAAVAAALLGSASVVYAAQGSLPDQPLYPLKLWSEDTRLAASSGPNERLRLLIEFSQRRVAEMDAMQDRAEVLRATEARLNAQMTEAARVAQSIGDLNDDARQSFEQLQRTLTPAPTSMPTSTPIPSPTIAPSTTATTRPTAAPTSTPTNVPTNVPTTAPSETPIPENTTAPAPQPAQAQPTRTALPTLTARSTPIPPPPPPPPRPSVRETMEAVRTALPPKPDIRETAQTIHETAQAMATAIATHLPEAPEKPPEQPPERPEQPKPPEQPSPPEQPRPRRTERP